VAFDALVSASDAAKDYATNGYLAKNRAEELPAKEYTVQITQDLKDVTSEVLSGVTDAMSLQTRSGAIGAKIRSIQMANAKPDEYSAGNVPYKPKKFLSISMGGIKENDFVMVMGYPGSTKRYRESYSVAYNQDVFMPLFISLFHAQIDALQEEGKANRDLQIKLQSKIFDIANTLKDFEGSVIALRREKVVEQKRKDEAEFTR